MFGLKVYGLKSYKIKFLTNTSYRLDSLSIKIYKYNF
jgi:hypothetical protein